MRPELHSLSALLSRLRRGVDSEIDQALGQGPFSGAVVLVGRRDKILYHRAYGVANAETGEVMTTGHLFDLASLTKPLATAVAVLLLNQEGKLGLDKSVNFYLDLSWEKSPTIRQLLTHHGGIPPEVEPEQLFSVEFECEPGEQFLYSDVGFMLLGRVIEKVSRLTLDQFFCQNIAEPLGLPSLSFRPGKGPFVPTFGVNLGEVHDPRARATGGVAGHAGLFGTALDVHLELAGLPRLLSDSSYALLYRPDQGGRTLGLDQDSSFSSARGRWFSPLTSAGHTGFTGTSFWWDEESRVHVVFLTSRLHPHNNGDVKEVRSRLATVVGECLLRNPLDFSESSTGP